MAYAQIEYDTSQFIRCTRCGTLKHRTYRERISAEEVAAILMCRAWTGFGYIKLSKYFQIHMCTIKRVVRGHERTTVPAM